MDDDRPLRIAIDARLASRGLGIATYATGLARALAARPDVAEILWLGGTVGGPALPKIRDASVELPAMLLHTRVGRRAASQLGVDVMHFPANIGPLSAWPVPYVLTVHDAIFLDERGKTARQRLGRRYLSWAVPRALSVASVIVTGSPTGADDVARLGGAPDHTRVIPHGPPERRRDTVPTGSHVVFFASTDPRKGTSLALRAWAAAAVAAPALAPAAELLVLTAAGIDDADARLAAASPRVRVLGRLEREELDVLVGGALALLHTSVAEGFGFPVLEAMAAGVPVVGGVAESVRWLAGDALLALDPADPVASLASALVRVTRDSALRETLSAAGRRRAAGFSWERSAEAHIAAYRAAIAGFGG